MSKSHKPITPWGKAKREKERRKRIDKYKRTAEVGGGLGVLVNATVAITAKILSDKTKAKIIKNIIDKHLEETIKTED